MGSWSWIKSRKECVPKDTTKEKGDSKNAAVEPTEAMEVGMPKASSAEYAKLAIAIEAGDAKLANEALDEIEAQDAQELMANEALAVALMEEEMKLLEMEMELLQIPKCDLKDGSLCLESPKPFFEWCVGWIEAWRGDEELQHKILLGLRPCATPCASTTPIPAVIKAQPAAVCS